MAPRQVREAFAFAMEGGMLSRTLAYATDGRNSVMIMIGVVLSCVINGDSVTSILRQATWLVVAVIVLIVVEWTGSRFAKEQVVGASS
ncbi:hypothetical protein ACIRTB_06890 [Streptomyces sp. NPDC101158]|uniref:hypothetical protein n=1 Tax=Streptomyces sp. NPDC101158 TaxID=3366117 RepID=UPI003804E24A